MFFAIFMADGATDARALARVSLTQTQIRA
jgi:hypothetical protein